jgi:hypothetical protein
VPVRPSYSNDVRNTMGRCIYDINYCLSSDLRFVQRTMLDRNRRTCSLVNVKHRDNILTICRPVANCRSLFTLAKWVLGRFQTGPAGAGFFPHSLFGFDSYLVFGLGSFPRAGRSAR